MIRQATSDDIPHLINLISRFNDEYYRVTVVNPQKLDRWLRANMENGVIYVTDTGFIAGLLVDDPMRDWTALVETGWYDTGRGGVRLLRRFIEFGETCGADEVRMTTLNTTPAGAMTLLTRMGFEEIERSHRLTL